MAPRTDANAASFLAIELFSYFLLDDICLIVHRNGWIMSVFLINDGLLVTHSVITVATSAYL